MSKTSSNVPSIDIAELIDQIYTTALDPDHFPEFITHWRHALAQDQLDFSELSPHFAQAEQLLARLEKADEFSKQPLNVSPHIAFQIDGTGNIHSANDLGQQFVGRQDSLPITSNAEQKLRKLAIDVGATKKARLERFVTTTDIDQQDITFLVSNISRTPIRPASALVVCTTVIWADGLNELLKQEFQFSKTELEIVRMLVEGKTSREIAAFRSRSWETIRTQLRKILNKAGVESQLDLVRLVLGYPAAAAMKSKQLVNEPWGRFIVNEVKDGQFVEYISAGKLTNRQVLFLHGSETNHMISRVLLKELLNQGASVLAPLRVGFGATSPVEKETARSTEAVSAVEVEVEVESISALLEATFDSAEKIEIIACGTGFHTALMVANAYPQWVKKLWVSEPALPNQLTPIQDSNQIPWGRSLAKAPEAIGFLVKASDSHIRKSGIEDYLLRHYATSLAAKKIQPDTQQLSEIVWSSEMVGRGLEGVIRDIYDLNEDWLDQIRDCKTDIIILEASSSVTPENDNTLVDLNPAHITKQMIKTKERLAMYTPGIAKAFQ